MGYVDRRLIGHWERIRTERDEERRFLTHILRERTGTTPSLGKVTNELERFRARLGADRRALDAPAGAPNPGDFD